MVAMSSCIVKGDGRTIGVIQRVSNWQPMASGATSGRTREWLNVCGSTAVCKVKGQEQVFQKGVFQTETR
jgi:hypothetical protein